MDIVTLSPSAVQFEGSQCSLAISRPVAGVVLIVLKGCDVGEFGDAPFLELGKDINGRLPFEVFVDARAVPSASIDVSGSWARWMMANRVLIQRFSILCQSRFIEITAKFVRQFTEFGPRMRIYTDAEAFDSAFHLAVGD